MRHLENINLAETSLLTQLLPDMSFRVAREQGREGTTRDLQHHARVVRGERRICVFGPYDPEVGRSQRESVACAKVGDGNTAGFSSEQPVELGERSIERIAARGHWQQNPADPREPHHSGETSRVIGMRVGQHYRIQVPYPLARERGAQHLRIRTSVDKKRARNVLHQDGVTLADV